MNDPLILTRRSALLLAGAALGALPRLYATNGDFWNKKAPADWNADEVDKLLTKSPWAKEATAQMAPGEGGYGTGSPGGGYPGGGYPGGGGMGRPRGGIGIPGIGGIGLPGGMGGGRRGGRGRGGTGPSVKGTVRWESAQPILEASKKTLPDGFANHYVIAVVGFPGMSDRRRDSGDQDDSSNPPNRSEQDSLDDLKQFTILQPKGRELAQAGVVQRQLGPTFLFGFSKEILALSNDDKEVDFSTRIGRLEIKAKFTVKDMLYRGRLAV